MAARQQPFGRAVRPEMSRGVPALVANRQTSERRRDPMSESFGTAERGEIHLRDLRVSGQLSMKRIQQNETTREKNEVHGSLGQPTG